MQYVYWAIPGLLAGRPGPDEIEWNLGELRQAGFGALLSLHNGGLNSADISQHGFVHMLLPLPDTVPPSPEDIRTYRRLVPKALSFISQHVTNRIPTLVHCHAGKDRTGVVLVCYLSAYMEISPVDAIAKLRAIKPGLLSAEGYEELALRLSSTEDDDKINGRIYPKSRDFGLQER